jgi:hypothetical protein
MTKKEINLDTIDFKPDTSINQIRLLSDKNIENYLGTDLMSKLDDASTIPNLKVINKNEAQTLTLYFYPGSMKNEFSQFKVNSVIPEDTDDAIEIEEQDFKTESAVKLGMTLRELQLIKGKPDTIIKSRNFNIYRYNIAGFNESDFLRRYNMPYYSAVYKFENDRLKEFKFGFSYP